MSQIIYYIMWVVGAVVLWVTLYRVVQLEQQDSNTDMTYGHVVIVALAGFTPVLNLFLVAIICMAYPKLIDTSGWWINRSVHKGGK